MPTQSRYIRSPHSGLIWVLFGSMRVIEYNLEMEKSITKTRRHIFGFLDETGLLHTPNADRVFALGIITSPNTRELHRAIIALKNSRRYHHEFKFSDISDQNYQIYADLVDIFFRCTNTRFHSLVIDKQKLRTKPADNVSQKSYNKFAAELVAMAINGEAEKVSEYITVLADDISTRKDDNFEKVVREKIRKKHHRNALFGIARLESHAVSEIQIVDVLLGLVAYSFKIKYGLVKGSGARLKLLKHLQSRLGVEHLSEPQKLKIARGNWFEVLEKQK